MRPLELRVHGFRSYRDTAVFDWRGRHLVGIVGPIGAGKSSILDAIAFALYGKTPTFERDTKSLINQTASECHVELRFEVDGEVWRVARGLRRKGASGHQLQLLAADEPDAAVLEAISGERQVRDRVETLLGMDFAAFCRSVLLAQNRFADFLKATPRDRNQVLKGVFGYERFDLALEAAKGRVTTSRAVLDALGVEGTRLTSAREELDDAQRRFDDADVRASALHAAREPFEVAAEAARDAERRAGEATAARSRLADVVAAMPSAETIDEASELAAESAAGIATAAEAVERADAALADAEAAHAAVAERVGDQVAFAELVTRHEHLVAQAERSEAGRIAAEAAAAEADDACRVAAAAHEAAVGALDDAGAALSTATSAVTEAETALHAARHADMARSLRAELVAGDPCPVCRQPVATVPAAGRAPAIAAAERALERARRGEASARSDHRMAADATTVAQERSASARSRMQEQADALAASVEAARLAEAELAAAQSELVDRLGEGDPRALLEERGRELAEAGEAAAAASRAATEARSALDAARRAAERGSTALATLGNRLASVWGMLGEPREVAADPDSVRAAFVGAGETLVQRDEEAAEALEAARLDADRAAAEIAGVVEAAGLEPGDDLAMAFATASAERGAAEERVRSLRSTIEAGADLDRRITGARRDLELAARLTADLQPAGFLAFLLEEERRALAELGSTHLEELTGGAYRFTDDDRFEVLDLNAAGTERRADSLSGGETFLASLALALSLAEMVARGGGRLDAFFLDEGFGSLDPEHLDRAMDGIGRLVANDPRRLVVLVSHVDQMRETLEDLIVLDKHDLTGDTVVVAGATRP